MKTFVVTTVLVLISAVAAAHEGHGHHGHDEGGEGPPQGAVEVTVDASAGAEASGLADAVKHHAESAPRAESFSVPGPNPCGDAVGVGGQTGIVGGSLAGITETCRAYRLKVLHAELGDSREYKLALATHRLGWFFRLLGHVATLGVIN